MKNTNANTKQINRETKKYKKGGCFWDSFVRLKYTNGRSFSFRNHNTARLIMDTGSMGPNLFRNTTFAYRASLGHHKPYILPEKQKRYEEKIFHSRINNKSCNAYNSRVPDLGCHNRNYRRPSELSNTRLMILLLRQIKQRRQTILQDFFARLSGVDFVR